MFCEVEKSYIEDGFNLYGLRQFVANFSDCVDLILDRIGPDDSDDSHLTQNACTLYGLIHARYIITAHGLDAMYNKVSKDGTNDRTGPYAAYRFHRCWCNTSAHRVRQHVFVFFPSLFFFSCLALPFLQYAAKEFGTCPLVQCSGQPVLPVGLKDELNIDTVKVFCPKCQCVYHPPPIRSRINHHGNVSGAGNAGVDGAYFGTTFPHLFLMTFSNLVPNPLPRDSTYIPRVFGFRVHQSAHQRNSVTTAAAGAPAAAQVTSSATRAPGGTVYSNAVAGGSRRVRSREEATALNDDRREASTRGGTAGSAAAAVVPSPAGQAVGTTIAVAATTLTHANGIESMAKRRRRNETA